MSLAVERVLAQFFQMLDARGATVSESADYLLIDPKAAPYSTAGPIAGLYVAEQLDVITRLAPQLAHRAVVVAVIPKGETARVVALLPPGRHPRIHMRFVGGADETVYVQMDNTCANPPVVFLDCVLGYIPEAHADRYGTVGPVRQYKRRGVRMVQWPGTTGDPGHWAACGYELSYSEDDVAYWEDTVYGAPMEPIRRKK